MFRDLAGMIPRQETQPFRRKNQPIDDDDAYRLLVNRDYVAESQVEINAAAGIEMVWKRGNESKSHGRYCECIGEVFAKLAPHGRTYQPHAVHNRKQLLSTAEGHSSMLPFRVVGTTDVLVTDATTELTALTSDVMPASPSTFVPFPVVMQVKKPGNDAEQWTWQSTAELFATDMKSSCHVIALVTDLVDKWTFQWLARGIGHKPVLHRVIIHSKIEALTALASFLKNFEDAQDDNGNQNPFRRIRVHELDVQLVPTNKEQGST